MEKRDLEQLVRETVTRYFEKPGFLVAGNWKMNMTVREGMKFLDELKDVGDGKDVLIFPPYTTLAILSEEFRKRHISFGPQNFHYEDKGAYTGEISIPMIQELGCDVLLTGHSERRAYYQETDEAIQKKTAKGVRSGFRVMVCIGESLKERQDGSWKQVLKRQLQKDLDGLKQEELSSVLIAYEPVWAIGTGVSASPKEITETHLYLKQVMREGFGKELPILYGGSVNEKNAVQIRECPGVDGFLIGGASLKPDKFRKLIEIAREK